jgi:hypothetical protein
MVAHAWIPTRERLKQEDSEFNAAWSLYQDPTYLKQTKNEWDK